MQSIVVRIFLGLLLTISFLHAQKPDASVLRNMLLDKDPEIRVKAAEGLGRVGGRQAIVILRQGLTDNNTTVRIAVVEALGFIGGRLAMTVLSESLKDGNHQVRIRAVEALKDAGMVNSIRILQKAFGDNSESVRLHAALMLRKIGHRSGVPVLGKVAVDDKSAAVRAAAAAHLGRVGVKDRRAVGILSHFFLLVTKHPWDSCLLQEWELNAYVDAPTRRVARNDCACELRHALLPLVQL